MSRKSNPDSDLFEFNQKENPADVPLAVRMRPRSLDEILGQQHLLGEGKLLRRTVRADRWTSMIFYGPPGCGKTTLAQVISKATRSRFVPINAVASSAAELRSVLQTAQAERRKGSRTLLFVDEIHRFNKAQQDILMPDMEQGNIILIGATTHNPSFAINGPLLSRSIIFELKPLEENDLMGVLSRALQDPDRGLGKIRIEISEQALRHLARAASGDARRALNSLEIGALTTPPDEKGVVAFDAKVAEESCQRRVVYYDSDEDYHYDTISAFIKSMRGSDPDASVYWLAKMIYGGEDIRFIMRRILILASEDIGNADPQALILAASGLQAVEMVGMPESQIILSQLAIYMAMAPKSNASYLAISSALEDVRQEVSKEVPKHLQDTHYPGAKVLGRGGYVYPHGSKGVAAHEQLYAPGVKRYYQPRDSGFEKTLAERLRELNKSPS